jgi:hypothetical protein
MDSPKDRAGQSISSWLPLTILIVLGVALHAWVIARTEVAARDSIGFIRTALRFENEPWIEVIKSSEQPPGYALTVLAVSKPIRAIAGKTTVDTMVLSAQVASALMGILAIIPMVRLGRELGDRRIGWLAAGVFLALPGLTRMTSDGLSEATFLFWMSLTLWLGVRALRAPSAGRMLACGLGIAASYLTRPEGLEVAVVAGIVLVALQFTARRQAWRKASLQLGALMCGVLVGVGPYVAITGHLSNKNTAKVLVGDPGADPTRMLPYGQAAPPNEVRTLLAVWLNDFGSWHGPRWLWALQALVQETAQGFQYVGLGLALLGLIVARTRSRAWGGTILIAGVVALHALILCRMASLSGYLSERHVLIFVLAGCIPAGAALLWLGNRLRPGTGFAMACALLVALVACEVPVIAKPLHGNRAGHKAAGRFLASAATADDYIMDPFNWAQFYARPPLPPPEPANPKYYFAVIEGNDNQHSRLPALKDAKVIAALGEVVYHWPENKPVETAQVKVYRVAASIFAK